MATAETDFCITHQLQCLSLHEHAWLRHHCCCEITTTHTFPHTHTYLQGPKVDTRPTSPKGPMICPQNSTKPIDEEFHGIHAPEGSPVS